MSFLRQDNYDSYNFDSREQSQEIIDWAFLNVPNGSYKIEWYSVFFENEEDAAMCYLAYR